MNARIIGMVVAGTAVVATGLVAKIVRSKKAKVEEDNDKKIQDMCNVIKSWDEDGNPLHELHEELDYKAFVKKLWEFDITSYAHDINSLPSNLFNMRVTDYYVVVCNLYEWDNLKVYDLAMVLQNLFTQIIKARKSFNVDITDQGPVAEIHIREIRDSIQAAIDNLYRVVSRIA